MALNADRLGPVEYLVLEFPGSQFNGDVAPALAELVRAGTIHIIDLTFVVKDPDGGVEVFELADLPPELAHLFDQVEGEVSGLLSDEDLARIGAQLAPGSSGLIVLWEDVWAERIARAVRESGGRVASRELVPHELVVEAVAALPVG